MACLKDFVSFAAIRGYQPILCGRTLKSVRYSGRPEVDGLLYHGRNNSMGNMMSSYDINRFDNVSVTP